MQIPPGPLSEQAAAAISSLLDRLEAWIEGFSTSPPLKNYGNSVTCGSIPDPFWARVIGAGPPITAELARDMLPTDNAFFIDPASILPAGSIIPAPPFDAQIDEETMTVESTISGGSSEYQVDRFQIDQGQSPPTYYATGDEVYTHYAYNAEEQSGSTVVISGSLAYAFIETSEPTAGVPVNNRSGRYGAVQGAVCASNSVADIQAIDPTLLSEEGEPPQQTFTRTQIPTYEINGLTVESDGSVYAQMWLDPSGQFYVFSATGIVPIVAVLTGGFPSAVATTLAGSYTPGDMSLTVASAAGFPTKAGFWVQIGGAGGLLFRVASVNGTTFTGLSAVTQSTNPITPGGAVALYQMAYAWKPANEPEQPGNFSPTPNGGGSTAGAGNYAYCQPFPYADLPVDGSCTVLLWPQLAGNGQLHYIFFREPPAGLLANGPEETFTPGAVDPYLQQNLGPKTFTTIIVTGGTNGIELTGSGSPLYIGNSPSSGLLIQAELLTLEGAEFVMNGTLQNGTGPSAVGIVAVGDANSSPLMCYFACCGQQGASGTSGGGDTVIGGIITTLGAGGGGLTGTLP